MQGIPQEEMLKANVHFGHLRKKWNPKMLPYIFMERKGIHIIDLNKTNESLLKAASALQSIARSGRKILFVATKKQAKDIVADAAKSVSMPFVTERWLGGMLTNFSTIKKSIKKMQNLDKLINDESASNLTKKERLMYGREKEKLERVLGGIANLNRLPAALFIVDITHEHIALKEAKKLNLITFGMVDTNSDPTTVDYAIPANDDASKSVALIVEFITEAIRKGLEERQSDRAEMREGADDDSGERRESGGGRRRRRGGRRETGASNAQAEKPATPPTEKPAENQNTSEEQKTDKDS